MSMLRNDRAHIEATSKEQADGAPIDTARMARLGAWLVAHDRLVVGGVLAVTVALAIVAARVRFDFRYADLLPENHPFMEVQNRYHRNFSEANVLTVMIEARTGTI